MSAGTIYYVKNWQPIATAPRDGTEIVVFTTYGMWVCAWRDGSWDDGDYRNDLKATHWIPLPEPPK